MLNRASALFQVALKSLKHLLLLAVGATALSGCVLFHDNTQDYIEAQVLEPVTLADGRAYPSESAYPIENVEDRRKDFGEEGEYVLPKPPSVAVEVADQQNADTPLIDRISVQYDGSDQPTLVIAGSFAEAWLLVSRGLSGMDEVELDDQSYDEGMFEIERNDQPFQVKLSNSSNGILISLLKKDKLAEKAVSEPFLYQLQDAILALNL